MVSGGIQWRSAQDRSTRSIDNCQARTSELPESTSLRSSGSRDGKTAVVSGLPPFSTGAPLAHCCHYCPLSRTAPLEG